VPLEAVIITRELSRRTLRDRDLAAEHRAVTELMEDMASAAGGTASDRVLQRLVETTCCLCQADSAGISMLEPSQATDQNAFIVTQDFADENNHTTLSDMAALGDPIKLAAPADCEGRSDCEAGLTNVYGFTIDDIVPLDFGSAQLKDAVTNGEVDLGETGTTDGSLEQQGLVILEDDKGIQPAQNLTPAVNADFLAANPDLEDVFNELSAALTTEDLAEMNLQVDAERQKPEDVAAQFLEDKGLL